MLLACQFCTNHPMNLLFKSPLFDKNIWRLIFGFWDQRKESNFSIDFSYLRPNIGEFISVYKISERLERGDIKVTTFQVDHHPNHQCCAISGDYILVPSENSGEDAFYSGLRLFNWKTGKLVKQIQYPDTLPYIECEWDRQFIPNSSLWYVID
jgi:hypothetical protein